MNEINISQLQDEAQRLLFLDMSLLKKIQNEPNILSNTSSCTCETQQFGCGSIGSLIYGLHEEQAKLDDLEMVLAITGTFKAGKSTTINAIVGTEVLPSRNRPMTALPTLIRHTAGQIEPILKINNIKPINEFIFKINQATMSQQGKEKLQKLECNSDTKELLDYIQENKQFSTAYYGTENIFCFLQNLSTLTYLSETLDIDFPFSDYDKIHELPIIEIEFKNIAETQDSRYHLTLLEIPCLNASWDPLLIKSIKNNLSKASSVLAILDSTFINHDEYHTTRKELECIINVVDRQPYILINKIDQMDDYNHNKEKLISHVSNHVLQGNIKEENIFTASSNLAYLSSKARSLLSQKESLYELDWSFPAWFHEEWEENKSNTEKLNELTDSLLKFSLFEKPLNSIIKNTYATHKHLTLKALEQLLSKLKDHACKLSKIASKTEEGNLDLLQKTKTNDIKTINNTRIDLKRKIHDFLCDCEELSKDIETYKAKNMEKIN